MDQNCEYPQCGTPTGTGIFRSFKNITGKGKSHIDVWLCDRGEALRRATTPLSYDGSKSELGQSSPETRTIVLGLRISILLRSRPGLFTTRPGRHGWTSTHERLLSPKHGSQASGLSALRETQLERTWIALMQTQ